MQNRVFDFIILGLWILIAVVLYVQVDLAKNGAPIIAKSLSLSEEEIDIRKISILGDNLFDLVLEDQSSSMSIVGKIDCDAINCTDSELRDLFRKATKPKAVLIQKQSNDVWLLKINFTLGNKRTSLGSWLNSRRVDK